MALSIMLVCLKEPMGYSTIDGHRICGRFYSYGSFGPTSVSREVYFKHRDILEEVEITGKWLSKRTGKSFPDISFMTTKLLQLSLDTTIEIAKLLDIQFVRTRKPNRGALNRAIVKRIELL